MKQIRLPILLRNIGVAALMIATPINGQIPSGKEVVAPEAFASYDPAAKGNWFQIAVVMKIRPGFHVNAREASADYLIPTELKVQLPAGFKAGDIQYPKGKLQTFSFSRNKPLNVYTDSVVVRLPLMALANAPSGTQHVPLKLHYQACSNEVCLPPVTQTIDAVVNLTETSSSARPVHLELFPQKK